MLLGAAYVSTPDPANFIRDYLENPALFLSVAHGLITLLSVLCAVYFFSHRAQDIAETQCVPCFVAGSAVLRLTSKFL